MNKRNILIVGIFLIFLSFIYPSFALAAPLKPQHNCPSDREIETAIGCIPVLTSTGGFMSWVFLWAIGVGGGIAFLFIVYSGFIIITSSGNPQRVQAGKELLTAAISGLLLLIFATFILRVVGVDILGIFS